MKLQRIPQHTRHLVLQPTSPLIAILSVLSGLVMWEIAGRYLDFRFIPPFSEVIVATYEVCQEPEFWEQFSVSLQSLAIGYVMSVVFGVALGVLSGMYQTVEYFLDMYLTVLLSAPKLIFAPILLSFFGTSRDSQVALIMLYATPIIIVNSMAGVRAIQRSWVEMARSFGATSSQMIEKIVIPGALPLILSGLSIGISRAVNGMIAGEMFIAFLGIGALLRQRGNRFDIAGVWGILVVIILLSFTLLIIFDRLTKPLIQRYRY